MLGEVEATWDRVGRRIVLAAVLGGVLFPLSVDSLSGEVDSGVMQALASKPVSRAAILLGKTLTCWLMAAEYLLLMAGGGVSIAASLSSFVPPHLSRALPVMVLGTTVPLAMSTAGGARGCGWAKVPSVSSRHKRPTFAAL